MMGGTRPELVGVLDLGGTHVTAARADAATITLEPRSRRGFPLRSDGDRDELLDAIRGAAVAVATPHTQRWVCAVPGPFDYDRGIALFEGVAKFASLYGTNLRAELAAALPAAQPDDIRFLNDADAFLLGEWATGAVHGHRRCVGLTLGTGVGSAFLADGRIIDYGPTVPAEGRIDLLKHRGRRIEETFSRRALLAAYGPPPHPGFDVKELTTRAREGDERARTVLTEATGALGSIIASWLDRFSPTALVVGGSIAAAWELLYPTLSSTLAGVSTLKLLVPTQLGDNAALLGATSMCQRVKE